jgi:glutaredoxin-like protein NrdH
MTDEVVIFTTPGCTSCGHAKAFLEERGVPFVERNLAADSRAMEELIALGARMLPVVRVGSRMISGFDPAAIGALLQPQSPERKDA